MAPAYTHGERLTRVMEIARAPASFSGADDRSEEGTVKTLPAMLLSALCAMPASACDKVDAAQVQLALAEMGVSWSQQGGRIAVEWGRAWDGADSDQRLRLLRTFAQGDKCLSGVTRAIDFHRNGRLVGTTSAAGLALVPDPVKSAGAAAPAHACP